MTTDPDDREPVHTASPTARILDQLQLHGFHPRPGEPDPRPLPEDKAIDGAVDDIFDALTGTLADTPLECVLVRSDNESIVVNLNIEAAERVEEVYWIDPIHR